MNIQSPLRFLKRLNIRSRLLLLCLAVAAPLLILSGFSIWRQYQTLNNEAKQATTFQAAIAVRTLSHWISGQEDALKALASLPEVSSLQLNNVYAVLKTAVQAEKNWWGVALVSPTGRLLATDKPPNTRCLAYLVKQPFFQKAVKTGKPSMSNYSTCPITGHASLEVAAPVISNKKVKAVLIASIKPDAVLSIFSGLEQTKGSVIAVIDANHRVLARTLDNNHWVGKDFSHARTVRASAKAFRGTLEATGIADPVPRAYAFDHVPETMWLVIIGVPTQAIYGPAQDWLTIMLLSLALGIGMSIILAYAATNHFTRPIYALVREALAIGRGDLSKRVKIRSEDELGLLAQSFNQMAINLELNYEHNLMVERISESIRQSLDLDRILNITVSEMGKALSASRCCLALIETNDSKDADDQKQIEKLEFRYSYHDSKHAGERLTNRFLFINRDSIFRKILDQGTVMSLDVIDPNTLTPLFENTSMGNIPADWKNIKSLIACPIATNKKTMGLILVQQMDNLRTWIEPELKLVEAVARQVALAVDQAHLYGMSKQLAEQELLVNHIVRAVRSSLDLDTILSTVSRELGEAIEVDRCQIALPRPEGPLYVSHEFHIDELEPMRGLNIYSQKLDFQPVETYASGLRSVLGIDLNSLKIADDQVVVHDTPLAVLTDVATDERAEPFKEFLALVGTKSLIAAPLLEDRRLLGVLIVHQCLNHRTWTASELSLVASVADQVAVAISHARLFAQVKYQAITDGLTGLYNHVYLKNRLTEELRRAQRKDTPCSLLMLDLDWLKQINDNFGHPVGDNAIRQVAWTLKNLLRSGDTAARYGGEEFSVILPETPLSEAALIADRLCRQVNNCFVPGLGKISVSVGCATYPLHADSPESLIETADKALYQAKRLGRNRVAVYDANMSMMEETSAPQKPNTPVLN